MKQKNRRRVFCLGLHKTGTTSLKYALESVGYQVADYFGEHDPEIRKHALPEALIQMVNHDAAQDDPWWMLYQELDEEFPGSQFILLTREKTEWFNSCLKYFGGSGINHVREWFYGDGLSIPSEDNREHWIERHCEFEEKVRNYFAERDDDFIELAVCHGEGWDKLAPFLGLKGVKGAFPKANTSASAQYAILHDNLYQDYLEARGLRKLWLRIRRKYLRHLRNRTE
ncbi:MAG: sulfotransferase [Fuerstiella sp.]